MTMSRNIKYNRDVVTINKNEPKSIVKFSSVLVLSVMFFSSDIKFYF
jgi:hypothetical protein